ncbi:MAG: hypothetical protein JSW47_12075, partial [Phycisphaerales bacterium]
DIETPALDSVPDCFGAKWVNSNVDYVYHLHPSFPGSIKKPQIGKDSTLKTRSMQLLLLYFFVAVSIPWDLCSLL